MGVPKIAVIAIVAIIAVPILLGYAMNLNEITVTDYKSNEDPVNVTELLQTGTDWSIAYGDPYQMNGFSTASVLGGYPILPIYNTISNVRTSIPLYAQQVSYGGGSQSLTGMLMYEVNFDYVISASVYVTMGFYRANNTQIMAPIDGITHFRWDGVNKTVSVFGYYNNNPDTPSEAGNSDISMPELSYITMTLHGMATVPIYYGFIKSTGNTFYADLADGYYYKKMSGKPRTAGWDIDLPDNSSMAILSINLDSITANDYTVIIEETYNNYTPLSLVKTTTGGVVSWQLKKGTTVYDLYYNPDFSDNTYQVVFTNNDPNQTTYEGHAQFRYVGHWSKTIGEANYYQTYDIDYDQAGVQGAAIDSISIKVPNDATVTRTPTIRIDSAQFRAYEYPVVEGSLNPSAFKTNPATIISKIDKYGSQIIFGGNTYNVTDGNITIGTHQIPVKNMVFDSVPAEDSLNFENRINGTVVSTTATPSTIQFVGKWGANITVSSMSATSITKTEWQAGSFGWDGMDHNFLIVGLLTSVGAFIALGIYMRRTKASLWPLLIVCGGAAVLFFIML